MIPRQVVIARSLGLIPAGHPLKKPKPQVQTPGMAERTAAGKDQGNSSRTTRPAGHFPSVRQYAPSGLSQPFPLPFTFKEAPTSDGLTVPLERAFPDPLSFPPLDPAATTSGVVTLEGAKKLGSAASPGAPKPSIWQRIMPSTPRGKMTLAIVGAIAATIVTLSIFVLAWPAILPAGLVAAFVLLSLCGLVGGPLIVLTTWVGVKEDEERLCSSLQAPKQASAINPLGFVVGTATCDDDKELVPPSPSVSTVVAAAAGTKSASVRELWEALPGAADINAIVYRLKNNCWRVKALKDMSGQASVRNLNAPAVAAEFLRSYSQRTLMNPVPASGTRLNLQTELEKLRLSSVSDKDYFETGAVDWTDYNVVEKILMAPAVHEFSGVLARNSIRLSVDNLWTILTTTACYHLQHPYSTTGHQPPLHRVFAISGKSREFTPGELFAHRYEKHAFNIVIHDGIIKIVDLRYGNFMVCNNRKDLYRYMEAFSLSNPDLSIYESCVE